MTAVSIEIPEYAIVVLIGPSGSGKSTFARTHFKATEVLSSDHCRALVSDDENDQAATVDAFAVLHFIAGKRLAAGRLVVVDATNVQPESRKPLVELARQYHALPVAIVFQLPEKLCQERNAQRDDRQFGPHVVRQQSQQLRRSLRNLRWEGFRHVHVLKSVEDVRAATIDRRPMWNNRKQDHGPFDIIGDIHGCFDELCELLGQLGYGISRSIGDDGRTLFNVAPPPGRKVVFLGDLVDRGPESPQVLRLVMDMVASGNALCVPGNHDIKLMRKLKGANVQITHGLAESLEQLDAEPASFRERVVAFIDGLVSHYVLDDGKLVVAHAGMKAELQGRGSRVVREFALFGETTGETDEFGLPVRFNWAAEYRGRASVVYGHTPVPEPQWLNHTLNIDTGCVFGGSLTALRYPEGEIVSVRAHATYARPSKPIAPDDAQTVALSEQQRHDDVLDIEDLLGKRIILTKLAGNVIIRENNAAAALEVMSRFAADPRWLIYLPPTMSPCETSSRPDLLEHPSEAFGYFRNQGVPRVVCEQKHMGSRAIVIICRNEAAARQRFGATGPETGICYTRTGRRFFDNAAMESVLIERVRQAAEAAGLWDELHSDWMALDCELMPWSAKARALLAEQYAPVGAAARTAITDVIATLRTAIAGGTANTELLGHFERRLESATRFVAAYRGYCWNVSGIDDLKLAPFHLLATERAVHSQRDHVWHMETLRRLCECDSSVLLATPHLQVDLLDEASQRSAIDWWERLTESGGEGIVIKPFDFAPRGTRGRVQPALKCRGREYLRIIYGPDYDAPENLERLRTRGLALKRSLALREFALGIEALDRFVRREPLRRVHECVFGVLAMESEPIDPRL